METGSSSNRACFGLDRDSLVVESSEFLAAFEQRQTKNCSMTHVFPSGKEESSIII